MEQLFTEIYLSSYGQTYNDNNHPQFLLDYALNEVVAVQLAEAEIPLTFYVFDSIHNTLNLQEGATPFSAVISVGNYDSAGISTALSNALNASSPNGFTYIVSISTITGKMTITASGSFQLVSGGTINRLLGLPQTSTAGTTITGSNVVQLSYPNFIYIRSNIGSMPSYSANIDDNDLRNNILARIPLDQNSSNGSIVFYKATNDEKCYFKTDGYLQSMDYYFTMEDINFQGDHTRHTTLDFNGAETSIKVRVFCNRVL